MAYETLSKEEKEKLRIISKREIGKSSILNGIRFLITDYFKRKKI